MEYGFLLIVSILGLLSFFSFLFYLKKNKIFGDDKKKFRWSYIFIVPYLIESLNKELYGREKLLKKSELIGWGLVLLLVIIVVTFGL